MNFKWTGEEEPETFLETMAEYIDIVKEMLFELDTQDLIMVLCVATILSFIAFKLGTIIGYMIF